jgi:hypothetical protein
MVSAMVFHLSQLVSLAAGYNVFDNPPALLMLQEALAKLNKSVTTALQKRTRRHSSTINSLERRILFHAFDLLGRRRGRRRLGYGTK